MPVTIKIPVISLSGSASKAPFTFADFVSAIPKELREGREAFAEGKAFDECPYPEDTTESFHWGRGWYYAHLDVGGS